MKTILKLTVILLAVLLFTTCKKYPYYEEGVSFTTLLKSNTWKMTEFTLYNTMGNNNSLIDKFETTAYGDEEKTCLREYTYTFDLDNDLYIVWDCNGDTIYSEKSIKIKHNIGQNYEWEIMYDTVISFYKWQEFNEFWPSHGVFIYSDYWKVDYLSSEKFQVSKTYHSIPYPIDSLVYTRVYEIVE